MSTPLDIAASITAANKPLIRFAPTTVVLRRWRRHQADAHALAARIQSWTGDRTDAYWRLVDAYDDASDAACAAYFVLVERGLEPCSYCQTVPPQPHHAHTCPDLLDRRLYGSSINPALASSREEAVQ